MVDEVFVHDGASLQLVRHRHGWHSTFAAIGSGHYGSLDAHSSPLPREELDEKPKPQKEVGSAWGGGLAEVNGGVAARLREPRGQQCKGNRVLC